MTSDTNRPSEAGRVSIEQATIISAYTGILMCDFGIFHTYVEKLLDRPVFTHELGDKRVWEAIKAAATVDFMSIIPERDDP